MTAKKRAPLTAERLREVLSYNPFTGNFVNLVKRGRCKPGDIPGGISPQGYWQISIDGRVYTAQSLAFLYIKGYWAKFVDHENRDKLDNRWVNLRETTQSQNQTNCGPYRCNKTGFKGVRPTPSGKFKAQITINRKCSYLGTYNTPQEAHSIYFAASQQHYGEFARAA